MAESRTQRWKMQFANWAKGGFVPEPISGWEWMLMRLGFAALVLWTFWDWHPYRLSSQIYPVGVAHFMDLTWLHEIKGPLTWVPRVGLYEEFLVTACVLMLFYVAGIGLRFVLPIVTVMYIMVWTFHNSQGYTYHGMQMITLTMIGQTLVVWWKRKAPAPELRAQLWYYSRGIILAGYVTSVLTKIVNSKGMWMWNSQYLSVEIIKTHRLSFYKDLEPEFAGDPQSAVFLLHHPYVAQVLFSIGFIIELLAWLGLRDRKWSCLMGLAIIGMHLSITWLMRLSFTNHQILCFIFLVNVPWLIALAIGRVNRPQLSPQRLPQ